MSSIGVICQKTRMDSLKISSELSLKLFSIFAQTFMQYLNTKEYIFIAKFTIRGLCYGQWDKGTLRKYW